MGKRKQISKKLRFDVFKRDSFECQYCGATPPKVVLQVDHIIPVKEDGDNSIDNLITSCQPCNIGKGASMLSSVPESLKDRAEQTKESELQIIGYAEVMEEKRERINSHAWCVADIFTDYFNTDSIRRDWLASIKRFNEQLGVAEVCDAMDVAVTKGSGSKAQLFKYFCGVCWNKIRNQDNG